MVYDPKTDASAPKVFRRFSYISDGSDVGQNRSVKRKDVKNPISLATPLAISDRFGAFDMRETIEQVISDQLKMILLTNKGERLGNFDFGADVRRILFESRATEIEEVLANSIQENVSKYMPGVRLVDMALFTQDQIEDLNFNEAMIRVGFSVSSLNIKSQIELVLADT